MLAFATDFPHAGSRCFMRRTGTPATIIQRRADGRALIRIDAPRGELAPQGGSGNRTEDMANLTATVDEAMAPIVPRESLKAPSSRRTCKARR